MTHGDLTFLLYVAWAALALWCIPWATILHAIDRAAQRRIDRMVADGLTAIDWTPGPDPFLDGPVPTRLVSGNRRIHHMVRAGVCAYWRKLSHDAAINAYGYADVGQAWHQRARIVITVRFPDLRRRDVSNLYPYVAKPLVDGLVDARVLPDDDDRHLVGPDLRRDPDRDATHCGTCGRAVVKRNGQPVRHKDQPGGVWCGRAS